MDPLSHAVIGWSLTTLRRPSGTRGVGLAGALGALSPDIDVALMPVGWDRYVSAHQAGTHSVIGAVACGALMAGLIRLRVPETRTVVLLSAAVAGACSHLVADIVSGGTMRLAWPLSDAQVGNLGLVAMADPYLVCLSTVVWIATLWARRHRTRCAAVFGAVLLAGLGVKAVARTQAVAASRTHPDARSAQAWMAVPVWASTARWRVFDRTADAVRAWEADAVARVARPAIVMPRTSGQAGEDLAIAASRKWDTVANFVRAHEFNLVEVSNDPAGLTRVLWSDVRYCQSARACAIWAGGEVDRSGHVRLLVLIGDIVQTR